MSTGNIGIWNGTLPQDVNAYIPRRLSPPTEEIIAHRLRLYIPPVLIVVGSIGNSLAFATLSRRLIKQETVCFYMAVLVVTNTVALYLSCGLDWISVVTERPHVATLHDWICKVWDFTKKTFESSSSWLLAAMTIDRFITTWFPVQSKTMCTVFIAKFVNCLIFVGLVAINIHSMWTFEVTLSQRAKTCSLNSTQHDFETYAWPYIRASFSDYLPTLCIGVLGAVNLCSPLCRAYRNNIDASQIPLCRVTVALSLEYLFWSLPSLIHNLFPYFLPPGWLFATHPPVRYFQWMLAYIVITLVKYCYYATGFVIYFLLLPQLRTDFRNMCRQLSGYCRARTRQDRRANCRDKGQALPFVHSACANDVAMTSSCL